MASFWSKSFVQYCFIVTLVFLIQDYHGAKVLADDKYTKAELNSLEKFRPMVAKYLTLDFTKEDKFLIRFLRARDYDLAASKEMLRKAFEWRAKNKIDNILDEDWKKWEHQFPYHLIVDKEGRPALLSAIGNVDFRRVFLGGLRPQLSRYIDYGLEKGVRNLHAVSNATGKEYIDGYIIFDLNGFNWKEHACVYCIPVWIDLIQHYEQYYPLAVRRIIAFNGPRIFHNLVQILKQVVTKTTGNIVELYGIDRSEWSRVLLDAFPAEELPLSFGGTKKLH